MVTVKQLKTVLFRAVSDMFACPRASGVIGVVSGPSMVFSGVSDWCALGCSATVAVGLRPVRRTFSGLADVG